MRPRRHQRGPAREPQRTRLAKELFTTGLTRTAESPSRCPRHGRVWLARRRSPLECLAQVRQCRHVPGTLGRRINPARHRPRTALNTEQIGPVNDERRRTRETARLHCLVRVDDRDREPGFNQADVVQCGPEQPRGLLGARSVRDYKQFDDHASIVLHALSSAVLDVSTCASSPREDLWFTRFCRWVQAEART